jgi:hypothetical protein
MILIAESSPDQDYLTQAGFKALTPLDLSVFAALSLQDFRGSPQNFGNSESRRA